MVLTVSFALSPVTGLFCHRRSADMVLSKPGRADKTSANLTPASGRQDHTTSPSAAIVSRPRALDRSQVLSTSPAITSRAKRCRVHRIPPRVRDDHDTPLLWGGMTRACRDDLPDGVSEIFLQTGLDTNGPTGKSPHGGESSSCLGRDAAYSTLLRSAGTYTRRHRTARSDAAHHAALDEPAAIATREESLR